MTEWDVTSYPAAVAGLRDRAAELADVPTRIHDHAIGDDGAPRFSPAFWRHVTLSAYTVTEEETWVVCPIRHERTVVCTKCDDRGGWWAREDVFVYPFRAAWENLKKQSSNLRPHPSVVVKTFLEQGCDPVRTAAAYPSAVVGPTIIDYAIRVESADQLETEKARIMLAIRALANQYRRVLPTRVGWLSRSESQRNADEAA